MWDLIIYSIYSIVCVLTCSLFVFYGFAFYLIIYGIVCVLVCALFAYNSYNRLSPKRSSSKLQSPLSLERMNNIPRHTQSQTSVNEQLHMLVIVANRVGLCDAADFIDNLIRK